MKRLKNGKKLTREQKVLLKSMGLDPKDYLCTKKTSDNFEFVHRTTEKILNVRR